MKRTLHVLVPRIIDEHNLNAQNQNAKELLSRFVSPCVIWHTFNYGKPDPRIQRNPCVRVHSLNESRFWPWKIASYYPRSFDAVFYPGMEKWDLLGLNLLRIRRGTRTVIATFEGVPGDMNREEFLTSKLGKTTKCFRPRGGPKWTRCFDSIMRKASSTIAISEHMQAICSALYLKQTEVLPLGIDANTFYSNCEHRPAIPVVVGAGTVYNAKRPEMFLALARKIKNAEFRWIGDGPSRAILSATAKNENLSNVSFPGSVGRQELARIFRQATVFALPSLSEGVPKVSQEAAACGLAQVIFGYYQSPTVVDGKNGLVVYDDDSFISAVERLVNDADLSRSMGERGALMSQLWNWDSVAPKWESAICQTIRSSLGD